MGSIRTLAPTWREWILGNVRRGCTPESMVAVMVENDFDPDFARRAVAEVARAWAADQIARNGLPQQQEFLITAAGTEPGPSAFSPVAPAPVVAYVPEPSRLPQQAFLTAGGCAVSVLMRLSRPDLALLAGVLTAEECQELIEQAQEKLARSVTVDPATGASITIEKRTSFGAFFHLRENPFIERIERRLAELLAWPVDHAEGLQIIRYQVGGEYRPHFDYFPPQEAGSAPHLANGGQRIASLVIYLNTVAEGGETIFPEINLAVTPHPGHAVYFAYCNALDQLDPLTLHGGEPVRRGEKWIATKWLRQRRRGG